MRIYRIEHEGETFEYEAESVYLAVDNWIDEHFDEDDIVECDDFFYVTVTDTEIWDIFKVGIYGYLKPSFIIDEIVKIENQTNQINETNETSEEKQK